MITVYGLNNCDTCTKARKWLDAQGINHHFNDVRKDQLNNETIAAWIAAVGWEILLNRRSTTWRNLADADKHAIDAIKAQSLMCQHPALIKRPVFDLDGTLLVGFKEDIQAALKEFASER